MSAAIPENVKKLLQDKNYAHLGTLMKDGSPQVSVVWIDVEGDRILVNTAEGRAKPRNVRRDPRVAISITDNANAYQTATVRGRVVEITAEGADAHIDKLAKKYLDADTYPYRQAGEQRLIMVIEPDHVTSYG